MTTLLSTILKENNPDLFDKDSHTRAQQSIVKSNLFGDDCPYVAYTLDNCLTPEECQAIRKGMDTMGYDIKWSGNRLCCRNAFQDPDLSTMLFERLQSFLPQSHLFLGRERNLHGLNPQFRAIKYRHEKFGHKFGKHIDFSNSGNGLKSFYTFMIYLNEEFEGGETVFLKKGYEYSLKPKTGTIIVFEQDQKALEHEGLPIRGNESVEKYILRSDVFYSPIF